VHSLRELQRTLGAAVLGGHTTGITELVRENGIPAAQRVAIYANNTRIGFEQALAASYPVIERLAGTDWFRQHAHGYQLRFPSRCGDLQYVGDRYAEYLQAELADTSYRYFADVARLEWAYQEALIAADSAALDPKLLAAVADDDYERLIFTPQASVRLVESCYPILAIWKTNQSELTADTPPISLTDGPDRLLVIRRQHHVELRALRPELFALLQQFTCGLALGAAADAVASRHENFDVGAALRELVMLQAFARCRLPASVGAPREHEYPSLQDRP
jgi:Putative DNA-binding domain